MSDWIPVVSQVKSLVQLIGGDKEGAKKTQISFSKQCPGVSQLRSFVEFASCDPGAALQTQKEFLGTVSGFANAIPVVGHVKGVVHYAAGDKDGGDNAMKLSSRTIGVIIGGAGGFIVGGPPGSVAGGMAGGVIIDGVTTIVDSEVHGHHRPAGYFKQIGDIIKDPKDPGKWFDVGCAVVGDGMTGFASGQAVQKMTKVKTQDGVKNLVEVPLKKETITEKIAVTETVQKKIAVTKTVQKKMTVTEKVKTGNLETKKSFVYEFETIETIEVIVEGMENALVLGSGVVGVGIGVGVVLTRE